MDKKEKEKDKLDEKEDNSLKSNKNNNKFGIQVNHNKNISFIKFHSDFFHGLCPLFFPLDHKNNRGFRLKIPD
jgi:hypothetical protein